jgi:multidrug efflux pump subunit AcrB
VEFKLDADMGRAMQEVRDRIAMVQAVFPKDAKAPTVARFNTDNSQPVVVLALLSPNRSARELSLQAEQVVAKRLQRVSTSPGSPSARCASTWTRRGCAPTA